MRTIKEFLAKEGRFIGVAAIIISAGSAGLYIPYKLGYFESPDPEIRVLEGKITKIGGTAPLLMRSSGSFFGNESVQIGDPSLIVTTSTNNGEYVLEILPSAKRSIALMTGSFSKNDSVSFTINETYFPRDKIGSIYASKFFKK